MGSFLPHPAPQLLSVPVAEVEFKAKETLALDLFSSQHFFLKIIKHTENLKELCTEHLCSHHPESAVNIPLILSQVHPSPLPIKPLLLSDPCHSKLQRDPGPFGQLNSGLQ